MPKAPEEKSKKRTLKGKIPARPVAREELNNPQMHDASHERDERCVPVAHELVKMLANMEYMPVGSHINEKETPASSAYLPVIRDFMRLLIEKDVKIVEISYIFSLARQALEFVSEAVDETLNQNMNRVTEMIYNLPKNDSDEITVKSLNEVVMRKEKINAAIKPILDEAVEMKEDSTAGE